MAYSDFTLEKVSKSFELKIIENVDIFAEIEPIPATERLKTNLEETAFLARAINTEKARSEFLIAPILLEVKRHSQGVSLFSGIDFNVAPSRGLSGFVDFILSKSPEQYFLQSPVITIVEAKNENIKAGLGQAIAEMVAAAIFNGNNDEILGVVTTGELWNFLTLEGDKVQIDRRTYFLDRIDKILGILLKYL